MTLHRPTIRLALLIGMPALLVGLATTSSRPQAPDVRQKAGAHEEPAHGAPRQEGAFAITGVDVITMEKSGILEDHTVVVRDGEIVDLGPRDVIAVPPGAKVVDGAGRWLIPGLFDTHVHLRELEYREHLLLYLANGVTTIQSMNGSPWHLELREKLRRGELLGPRMLTTGPTTAAEGVSSPAAARRLVERQVQAGYDAIKQYGDGQGTMDRPTYHALAAAAREHGIRLVGHAPRSLSFSAVLEEGQSSIDHMEEVVYTSRAIVSAFQPYLDIQFGRREARNADTVQALPDLDELQPAIEVLAGHVQRAGLAVTPTLVAFGRIQDMTTDEIFRLVESPAMRYIDPTTRVGWRPAFNSYRAGGWADKLDLISRILERSHELQMRLTAAFHAAGVPIMTGTDAALPFVFPGFALHEELELLVESGLTAQEALRAATVVPADQLGIGGETGSLDVGKRADLVLLDANPLAEIANTSRIVGVAVDGRWLTRAWIDSTLAAIESAYEPVVRRIEPVVTALEERDARGALERYHAAGDTSIASFVERSVNTLGYRHLRAGDTEAALRVFKLNTEHFPRAWNTWDSLAEAYMTRGDDDAAIRFYEKSLELNPDNDNAKRMLERIRSRQEGG